jgi:hypothetical protein
VNVSEAVVLKIYERESRMRSFREKVCSRNKTEPLVKATFLRKSRTEGRRSKGVEL